jgi:hypothetical protein
MLNSLIGIIASSGVSAAGGDYESIATVTVGAGGASTVTFSSIPSTYKHLQFRIYARSTIAGTSSDNIAFRINGDTGSNYSTHNLYGTGAGAYAAAFAGLSYAYFPSTIASSGNLSNTFAGVVADFLDYADTNKNKTVRALGGYDENANSGGFVYDNRIQLSSAFWNSTSAMSSIVFQTSANFAEYTTFALYGIKG